MSFGVWWFEDTGSTYPSTCETRCLLDALKGKTEGLYPQEHISPLRDAKHGLVWRALCVPEGGGRYFITKVRHEHWSILEQEIRAAELERKKK